MSLTTGQKQYLLELLSHEYVLTEEQQPIVRQAVCRYATTVYDQQELDFLLTLPQSLAVCLYYQGGKQALSKQYGLWLNCLEHCIFQEISGLDAVLINPDPTGSEKILAITKTENDELEVFPLPQLKFSNQIPVAGCSRWTLQEARESMHQFMQYAHQGVGCHQEAEPLTWSDLLQQARLFPMVKETYQFAAYADGLPQPKGWQTLKQLPPLPKQHTAPQRSWIYQPPANPFAAEMKLMQHIKKSISAKPHRPIQLPEFPAPPQNLFSSLPPLPIPRKPFSKRNPF